jgi:hypothetical protein
MPRPKQTTPSVFRNIALPQPIADKLDLILFSELEGRIPTGAYKIFFTNCIEQYFEQMRNPCPHCNATGVKGLL